MGKALPKVNVTAGSGDRTGLRSEGLVTHGALTPALDWNLTCQPTQDFWWPIHLSSLYAGLLHEKGHCALTSLEVLYNRHQTL